MDLDFERCFPWSFPLFVALPFLSVHYILCQGHVDSVNFLQWMGYSTENEERRQRRDREREREWQESGCRERKRERSEKEGKKEREKLEWEKEGRIRKGRISSQASTFVPQTPAVVTKLDFYSIITLTLFFLISLKLFITNAEKASKEWQPPTSNLREKAKTLNYGYCHSGKSTSLLSLDHLAFAWVPIDTVYTKQPKFNHKHAHSNHLPFTKFSSNPCLYYESRQ